MSKGLLSATTRKLPLRLILVVPFVVQIFAAVGVIGWLSFRNGQRAVDELAGELRQEITAHIDQKLNEHLSAAVLATQLNADALTAGRLDPSDQTVIADYLWDQLQQFPDLSGVAIATEDSHYVEIIATEANAYLLKLWDGHQRTILRYSLTPSGVQQLSEPVPTVDSAAFQKSSWYQSAKVAGKATWQSPHLTQYHQLVISLARPFYTSQGECLGVTKAELQLSTLNDFLHHLKIGRSGQVFLIERSGLLVATSKLDAPFQSNALTHEPERIKAQQSRDLLINQTTRLLTQRYGDLNQIQTSQQLTLKINGQQQYVQVTPFSQQPGLDWLMVITVPEADFMAAIHQHTRTTFLLCSIALALTTGSGLLSARWIVRPIVNITQAANGLSQGRWQNLMIDSPVSELVQLTQAFNRMANQLHSSFSTLAYTAQHDTLTGLFNRGALQIRLESAIEQRQHKFALFFLDLDDFKLVNDSFGHIVGDQLLIAIANRLQTTLNSIAQDTQHITFARFGGDEFVILLEPIDDATVAMQVANAFLQTFTQPFHLKGHEIYASTSIGIVLSASQGSRPEDYLRNADIALYAAKRNGKASYEIFDSQMHTLTVDRLALETDLRKAIRQQELRVYYQPIINCYTLRIEGFEALLRWYHPQRGLISPVKFIPIAEQSGLILDIGWWVMRQACTQMRAWQQQFAHCEAMIMSINFSSKQFSQPDCIEAINQILLDTGLPPHNVKLEITESIFLNCGESTESKLKWLRDNHIRLSIDDFGTGYSSLSYLYRFPVNTLKIDRSFIHRLTAYYSSKSIVEAIVLLAHKLGLDLVAEGVETLEELSWLQNQGCEYVQGFLFAPPATAEEITTLLSSGIGYVANSVRSFPKFYRN